MPKDSALFINPTGQLVEQTSPPLSFPDVLFQSGQVEETAINDVLEAITLAATDDDIKLIVLDLDDLTYASSAQVLRIGAALDRFKDTGKEIISYEDNFQQFQYHIASYANELYMHPWGDALLTGYGGNNLYFREMLEKLSVNVPCIRVGGFKSAVEPFTCDDMSEQAKLARQTLYNGLWRCWLKT